MVVKGSKLSDETKDKIRQAHLGKKLSEETKRKIGLNRLGKKHSEETKRKISLGNKGRIISEEQKAVLRKAQLGRKQSAETIEKKRLKMLGTKRSEETKRKMSEAQIGEKNHQWRGGRYKKVDGYVLIRKREHPNANCNGTIFEHRLVMEKKLGRYLTREEVVHHINGILDDNREENLMLFINDIEHRKYHTELRNNGGVVLWVP